MKLLYTRKQFQGMVEEKDKIIKTLRESYNKLQNYSYECLEERNKVQSKIEKLEKQNKDNVEIVLLREKEIQRLEKEVGNLKSKNRKSNSASGGLIKQINKLQAKLDEANIKLSQRYIIKELVAEKPKKIQVMGIKNGTRTSRIIKEVVTNGK